MYIFKNIYLSNKVGTTNPIIKLNSQLQAVVTDIALPRMLIIYDVINIIVKRIINKCK